VDPIQDGSLLLTNVQHSSLNRTVSGRLQHTTQDRTLQQSISFSADSGPQDRTAQRSVFLDSPEPSASLPHYLTCFTGRLSSRTVPGTLQLSTTGPPWSLVPTLTELESPQSTTGNSGNDYRHKHCCPQNSKNVVFILLTYQCLRYYGNQFTLLRYVTIR
jgi:hypothetical protein